MKLSATPWGRRLTALLLVLFMLVSMIPMTALAAEDGDESTCPPVVEVVAPEDESTGTGEAEEVPPPTEPEEIQEEQTARQDAMLAGGSPDQTYGSVKLHFPSLNNQSRVIELYSGQYITECDPDARVWGGVPHGESDYLVWYHEGILYLNGNLQDVRINLHSAKRFPEEPKRSVLVHVNNNMVMSGYDTLLDLQDDTDATLYIVPNKRLNLNLTKTAQSYSGGYAIKGAEGSNLTVCGGGELYINVTGRSDSNGGYAEGITLRGDLTLSESNIFKDGSPDVRINVSNDSSNTKSDLVCGVDVKKLTIKDESFLKIDVTGRALDPGTEGDSYRPGDTWGRVNWAINAGSMKVLDKASVEIISHKNVVSDIVLFANSEALKVDTDGSFNITNHGNITRYTEDEKHKLRDHPDVNIYLPTEGATANIVRAEAGMVIDSYSRRVNEWYDDVINGTRQWNWAIGGYGSNNSAGIEPTLGPHMYVGTRRIGEEVELSSSDHRYTWGQYEYIYSPTGVATVKQSPGLTMKWHTPEGASGTLHYASVMEPTFNRTYIVPKGGNLELTTGDPKGKFLYWYDALRPTGSGTGWTNPTQTFTNIQQDMVLVPAQLPTYGENTYAVKDLRGSPVMELRNSRLYADVKAKGAVGTQLAWKCIPAGSYRIACYDKDTGRCFFSTPFKFDPPVAPPYIAPDPQIFEQSETVPVKITAERNQSIKYRLWDYATNKWGTLKDYTGSFEVTVTSEQDVRIKAYAGLTIKEITSEVRYAVIPTGVPTVKYGDKVLSTTAVAVQHYFYGAIELTVEAPEGYEVWYSKTHAPYESGGTIHGTMVVGGKVSLDYGGDFNFKLAKVFTVNGKEYRRLSHKDTKVKLTKLDTLPTPNVTVKTQSGTTLTHSGNTYTMTENAVTVTLTEAYHWPLNATMAYDTNGNASPSFSKSYTAPFDLRGAGTLAVFTLVPKAGGGYEYHREAYTFQLAANLQTVLVSTYNGNCTAYYTDENGEEQEITGFSQALKVGTRVRVVPNPLSGQTFKKWEIGNYSVYNIWGSYEAGDYYNPELIFHVPTPNYNYSYGSSQPLTLTITATFATAAEASISGQTKVDLVMDKTVGESVSLNYENKEMRTISYQWWEGDSVGAADNVLPGAVTFDPDKTYTVKVTIKANQGASFTSTAGVGVGSWGGHFTVPNDKIPRIGNTLTFTATPVRQIDLTMPAPLTIGDPLPTTAQVGGLPAGVTAQTLEWPYTTGTTVPDDASVSAALTLKTDGTRPILAYEYQKPTVNGNRYMYARNSDSGNDYIVTNGSTVKVANIALPVKAKGVTVSGTITSYGNGADNVTVQLIEVGHTEPAYEAIVIGSSAAYSFETVTDGIYTLKVEKKGHAPWTETITVGSTAITGKDVTVYLWGDVNRDGVLTAADAQEIQRKAAGLPSVFDTDPNPEYCALRANVNGDSGITAADAQEIQRKAAGLPSTIDSFG